LQRAFGGMAWSFHFSYVASTFQNLRQRKNYFRS